MPFAARWHSASEPVPAPIARHEERAAADDATALFHALAADTNRHAPIKTAIAPFGPAPPLTAQFAVAPPASIIPPAPVIAPVAMSAAPAVATPVVPAISVTIAIITAPVGILIISAAGSDPDIDLCTRLCGSGCHTTHASQRHRDTDCNRFARKLHGVHPPVVRRSDGTVGPHHRDMTERIAHRL